MRKIVILASWILLISATVGLRLLAADKAYPVAGDAGHFVQHGVALANGVPGAMSTYWSQGMILIAAEAVKLGLDPRYILQGTVLICGILQMGLFAYLVFLMTGSRGWAHVGGWLIATSPTMVHYSITGYSEMPYMMLLTAGLCFGVLGMKKRRGFLWAAGVLIGLSGYFKGLDAAVAACGFGLFVLLRTEGGGRRRMLLASIVPIVAFIVLLPLCSFTYINSGSFTPGSKGGGNFALGDDWTDSKVVYSAEGMRLEEKSTWDLALQIPGRVARNSAHTFRLFNRQIFIKGFRMGTFWFFLLFGGILVILWRKQVADAILPACLLGTQLGLLWLVFVHERVLVASLPLVLLLFLLAWQAGPQRQLNPFQTRVARFILILFLAVNARYAVNAFSSEFFGWHYANIEECAKALREYGTDADVVMSYGPHLAVEFNQSNPLKTVEIPYGTLAEVEGIARHEKVRFIIISDVFRPHWPIARLFDKGVFAPENWILREELVFPEKKAGQAERCRIYERTI